MLLSEATVSPRIGHGHSEPIFNPEIVLDKIKSEIRDGRYWVRGMCQNCRRFRDKVYIDFLSTQQPMIYGIGPDQADLSSDDKSAGLRRHDRFGRFTFNMTEAVSGNLDPDSDFPRENEKSNNGSAEVGHQVDDQEYISYAHGLLMIAVFVVLFPLGSVWVRIFEKVRWHWINQAFGTALAFIGAALGVQLSRQYNRVRKRLPFPSPNTTPLPYPFTKKKNHFNSDKRHSPRITTPPTKSSASLSLASS